MYDKKTKKIEGIIWWSISFVLFVIAVIHPRIIYFILAVVCGITGIICYRSKKEKTVAELCKDMIGNIIAILILCYLGQLLNIFFPYHASYEYKRDIKSLKAEDSQEYYFFPDRISDVASKVKWICLPNLFQGTGYHKLFFYADESYLQEVYNTYAEYATVYTYEHYAWENNDTGKSITFPGYTNIEENDRKNVEVFVLYDNKDTNDFHNGGFYINRTEEYICFFSQ